MATGNGKHATGDAAQAPKRVAIYCRVSTDRQASKEDSSLDTQRDRLLRYLEDKRQNGRNWVLAEEFIEGEEADGRRRGKSAKNLDRPGFARLMAKMRSGDLDVVLFTKIDRISRSVIDFLTLVEEFERHGVAMVSLKEEINTDNASGRVMTTMMIALAQFEREQTSERTREKMAWRAGKGLPIGPPPMGYEMHEKHFRVVPEGAEAVHFLERTYLETRSLDKVTRLAHARGLRSRRGRVLSKNAIGRVLRSPFYTGLLPYKGGSFPGQHEAIRDQETHQRLQELLGKHWRHRGNGISRAKRYDYLLQGLVVCGYCHGRMVPKTGLGKGGRPYHYYVCSRADKTVGLDCQRNFLPAVEADRHVLDYLKDLSLRDDLVEKLCHQGDAELLKALEQLRKDRQKLKDQLAENRRQATNLGMTIARMGEAPPDSLLDLLRTYEREGRELQESLARTGEEELTLERTEVHLEQATRTVRALSDALDWPGLSPDLLREILPKFVNCLVWRKHPGTTHGRFELAIFERPFRTECGRRLKEIAESMARQAPQEPKGDSGRTQNEKIDSEKPGDGQNGGTVDSNAVGVEPRDIWRRISTSISTPHPFLDPDLEEAEVQKPPCLLLIDEYYIVYRRQRRVFISGKPPEELRQCRIIDSRTWRRYQGLKDREPPWEKALRCQARLAQEGLSIRDLARALGIHHSGIARTLELLKLPDEGLQALRRHGADTRVRAHFTEKRLRAALAGPYPQDLLAEIQAVLDGAGTAAITDPVR